MSYIRTKLFASMPDVLDFEPIVQPIIHDGVEVPASIGKLVINSNTNAPMGVVKERARPTPYRMLWEPLVEGLEQSGLDLTDAEVNWSVVGNGEAMFADIILKAYDFERVLGEKTSLKMRVVNSVNGTLAYSVAAMLMRLACLNGMSRPDNQTSVKFKHTRSTDPEALGKVASQWPDMLENDAHLFNHMKTVKVSNDDAETLFNKLCITVLKGRKPQLNKAWHGRMFNLWNTYNMELGYNAYALYNALTHYATHIDAEKTRSDLSLKAIRQEQTINTFVKGDAFKKLIRYDDFAMAA